MVCKYLVLNNSLARYMASSRDVSNVEDDTVGAKLGEW
jgi:hypothetical protein